MPKFKCFPPYCRRRKRLHILGPAFGRTDFSRIFIFEPPDFFADFLAGFFSPHFCGKSAQKNPPGKSPRKSSKIYTTKILQHISADCPRATYTEKNSETGRIRFQRVHSNTELSQFFGPSPSSGERTRWVPSQPIICVQMRTHRVFGRTHRVCPKTQWGSVSSLLRNSTLETVFRPFPKFVREFYAQKSAEWKCDGFLWFFFTLFQSLPFLMIGSAGEAQMPMSAAFLLTAAWSCSAKDYIFLICPQSEYRAFGWIRNPCQNRTPTPTKLYAHCLVGLGAGLNCLYTSTKCNLFFGCFWDVNTKGEHF